MYETENSGPSYWHFHAETSQEIREHLSSEYLVAEKISLRKTNLVWKPKAEHKPNHLWDAAVYATAAAEIAGVHTLRDPAATRDKTTYSAEKETQTDRPIKTKY